MDRVILCGQSGLRSHKLELVGNIISFNATSGDDGDGHVDAYEANFLASEYMRAIDRLNKEESVVVSGIANRSNEQLKITKETVGGKDMANMVFVCPSGTYHLGPVEIEKLSI